MGDEIFFGLVVEHLELAVSSGLIDKAEYLPFI